MPFSGLPDGPFRWGIVFNARIADSDSVNHGSNPGPSGRESASNRCVFVVSSLAGIVLKLPHVSSPANASRQPETPNVWVRGANGRRVSRGRFRVFGCGAFRQSNRAVYQIPDVFKQIMTGNAESN